MKGASMRPRRICRGNRPRLTSPNHKGKGFNEAPANLPGKFSSFRVQEGPSISFNEAPANLPGKCLAIRSISSQVGIASMRPRRICRGNDANAVRAPTLLQASMRPRRICRGNRRGGVGGADVGHIASMRPRRICRGNRRTVLDVRDPTVRASMRPRRICRGNTLRWPCFHLQKGRFNEAPANLPGK